MATDAEGVNYFGSAPGIQIKKFVNSDDADTPTGPVLAVGSTATFIYVVTNTGNGPLINVAVADDNATPGNTADDFNATYFTGDTDLDNQLDQGEIWFFVAMQVVTAGQHTNIGAIEAQDSIGQIVMDDDPANYFGEAPQNADFNADGIVNSADFVVWRKFNGTSVPAGTMGDANYDGQVNSLDYSIWQAQYGTSPGAGGGTAAVVEPQSASSPSAEIAIAASPASENATTPRDVAFSAPLDVTMERRAVSRPQTRRVARFMPRIGSSDWTTLLSALARQKAVRDATGQSDSSTAPNDDSVGERAAEHIENGQARWCPLGKSPVRGLNRR
jgi:hypothetical protein